MQAKVLLCDYAEVAQGKLFITGANINRVFVQPVPPHAINIALAASVTIPWNATNQPHTLTIELVNDQGDRIPLAPAQPGQPASDEGLISAQFNAGRSADMKPGEDTLMPLAIPMLGFPLPALGSYFFQVKIDGTDVDRVSFRVDVIPANLFAGAQF